MEEVRSDLSTIKNQKTLKLFLFIYYKHYLMISLSVFRPFHWQLKTALSTTMVTVTAKVPRLLDNLVLQSLDKFVKVTVTVGRVMLPQTLRMLVNVTVRRARLP